MNKKGEGRGEKRGMLLLAAIIGLLSALPLPSQAPAKWRGTIDLTIGAGDQAIGPYLFEDVRGLNIDGQGRILVAETKASEVRVFSAVGKHLFTIGRPGAGPADLREPCCIAFAPDGKLWVKEEGNHRYSAFILGPTKATYLYSVRMALTNSGIGSDDRVGWDTQGRLVDISGAHFPDHPFSGLLRSFLDSTGAVRGVDTIAPARKDSLSYFEFVAKVPGGMAKTTYYQNFGAAQLRATGPNGELATAVTSHYAVTWLDASKRRIALLQRAGEGPPVSAKEKAAAEKRDKSISDRIGQKLPFVVPAKKPILYALGFDLDGRLWIQRSVAEGAPREADVYDHAGRLLATVSWPANVTLTGWAIHGQTAIGIATDDDGVQRVVRLLFR